MESKNKNKNLRITFFSKIWTKICYLNHKPTESNNTHSKVTSEDKLIEHFLEARDMKTSEVMVPRADVVGIDADATLEMVKNKFITTGFLRLLVYRKDIDDIIGFIHLKDVFAHICSNKSKFSITDILTKTIYTARSTRCFGLFSKMQNEDVEMAIILDEYGGIEGIISIERLIDKMLGALPNTLDEDTQADPAIQQLGENIYLLDARTSIQKVEEIFNIGNFLSEEEGEYETIGGFILSYLDRMPVKGEKFTHIGGVEVEIIDASSRVIKTVKVTKIIQSS